MYSTDLQLLSQSARALCCVLSQGTVQHTVCSPRALVGPAQLSAGHAVVQGQRTQAGPRKCILCENGQIFRNSLFDLDSRYLKSFYKERGFSLVSQINELAGLKKRGWPRRLHGIWAAASKDICAFEEKIRTEEVRQPTR